MKKIVFFDGDGTLWYPKSTKRTKKPHWIYHDPSTKKNYLPHLILTPKVVMTLKKLQARGIITVIISTHPQSKKAADMILKEKVNHFELETFIDEIHTARNVPNGKTKVIERVLKRRKLAKRSALMVGDSYVWDFKAARSAGVDALLMESDYRKSYAGAERVKRNIKDIHGIFEYLHLSH